MAHFGPNVVRWIRALRRLGIQAGTGQVIRALQAVEAAGLCSRGDVYVALRSQIVTRVEQIPLFDAAFTLLWRTARGLPPPGDPAYETLHAHVERLRRRRQLEEAARRVPWAVRLEPQGEGWVARDGEAVDLVRTTGYSPEEVWRRRPLGELTPFERGELRQFVQRLVRRPSRRSRRWWSRPEGPLWDMRATARRALAAGGELVTLSFLRRRRRAVPLVVLCDVSGSMESLVRPLVAALHGLTRRWGDVESFVFGTRLTRITPALRRHQVDRALDDVSGRVLDWAGGTRIGESLAAFNRAFARRALRRGAVVLIVSDGWDKGDPKQLAQEMSRLQRQARRVVWINPMLQALPDRPEGLPAGMQAVLAYVDEVAVGRVVEAPGALAAYLNGLEWRRPVRPHRPEPERSNGWTNTSTTPLHPVPRPQSSSSSDVMS
ncbi:VWA domain-containing protein [Carboxydochorda subterranea]|uniref:VWA domain-containing protein n=1 Tax=Carboxydichorda subterranea TaxID=3109565 RepID=A0ABZ1BXF4_9FIRM|nr:VWA domain-containing protein [Limnochorda sp. L945t]WRP17369.1 VWA domain-containing protein [Limnochorda sp. L945t]